MRLLTTTILLSALFGCSGGGGPFTTAPAPMGDTIRTVAGTITYFRSAPGFLNNIDADGRVEPGVTLGVPTQPSPLPNVRVEIWNADETQRFVVLRTNAAGQYSAVINYGPNPARPVVVRVIAQWELPFGPLLRVLPNLGAVTPYTTQAGPAGDISQNTMTVNVRVDFDEGAGGFHIASVLFDAISAAKSGIRDDMPPIDVFWEPGNGVVSRFLSTEPDLARLQIAGGFPGVNTSNTDVWDTPKLARLVGEFLLEYFIHDASPEGAIDDDNLLVPTRAWREAFLDFFSCAARGTRLYWDTEGSGANSRIVRYFDLESFFDDALPRYGPDDPNVYQPAALVGIGSRFSIAEVLWDIHDPVAIFGDPEHNLDTFTFPLGLTLTIVGGFDPGGPLLSLLGLFDAYTPSVIDANILDGLLIQPEDQGVRYPPVTPWPPPFLDPDDPADPLTPIYDETLSDTLDTTQGLPETGFASVRYFQFNLGIDADATVTLTTAGLLRVEILDLFGTVLGSGAGGQAAAQNLAPGPYLIRVTSLADPQVAPFDIRLLLDPP